MRAILPEDIGEFPCGYAQTGHLAHLNLSPDFSEYKHIIAQVIMTKSSNITTVVNKIDDVGSTNIFRTFPMEVLAGEPKTEVELKHAGCNFKLDFAKVYWNTRLSYEHERLVRTFQPGEAISDAMAGVGPFAIPAAKRGLIVYGNDLNPESYKSMTLNSAANNTTRFLRTSNLDARLFIRYSIQHLHRLHTTNTTTPLIIVKPPKPYETDFTPPGVLDALRARLAASGEDKLSYPKTFAHFIMNLPASAMTMIDAYIGSYTFLPESERASLTLPNVHVYTFHREKRNSEEAENAKLDLVNEVRKYLEFEIEEEKVQIHEVRRVAPGKVMYCVSFQLPAEVAYREDYPQPTAEIQQLLTEGAESPKQTERREHSIIKEAEREGARLAKIARRETREEAEKAAGKAVGKEKKEKGKGGAQVKEERKEKAKEKWVEGSGKEKPRIVRPSEDQRVKMGKELEGFGSKLSEDELEREREESRRLVEERERREKMTVEEKTWTSY